MRTYGSHSCVAWIPAPRSAVGPDAPRPQPRGVTLSWASGAAQPSHRPGCCAAPLRSGTSWVYSPRARDHAEQALGDFRAASRDGEKPRPGMARCWLQRQKPGVRGPQRPPTLEEEPNPRPDRRDRERDQDERRHPDRDRQGLGADGAEGSLRPLHDGGRGGGLPRAARWAVHLQRARCQQGTRVDRERVGDVSEHAGLRGARRATPGHEGRRAASVLQGSVHRGGAPGRGDERCRHRHFH